MCTWLDFRPSYMTHSYTTLSVKGTILRWPLVTLSMHRKSADQLKETWHIVRLKKYGLQKYAGGGRVSTFSPWSTSVYGTWQSQAVTHPIMNRARRCLTSVIEPTLMGQHCTPYIMYIFCCIILPNWINKTYQNALCIGYISSYNIINL